MADQKSSKETKSRSNRELGKKEAAVYAVIAAFLIFIAIAYIYLQSSNSVKNETAIGKNLSLMDNKPLNSSTLAELKAIADNMTLADKIGRGSVEILPNNTNGTPINYNGKPTVLYLGADYCPFCAVTRWGLILALERFGNFTMLHYMTSSAVDVFPYTPTFTFYNSSYYSSYISFLETEQYTNIPANGFYEPLQPLTPLDNATVNKYDTQGAIPFLDFNNKSYEVGALVSPAIVNGHTWSYVINNLSNTNSNISKGLIGLANVYTAEICIIDNYTPSYICNQSFVKNIVESIKAS
ncbi:MAG: hypothetical protein ARM1_0197 [Candidatus Micrarchaeota archaeon]|nr:MAG: hypothetical protein ARM1_0197 [Candidatus Micrarchaeota archaeon]